MPSLVVISAFLRSPVTIVRIVSGAVEGKPVRPSLFWGLVYNIIKESGRDVLDTEMVQAQTLRANIPSKFACHGGRRMSVLERRLPRLFL